MKPGVGFRVDSAETDSRLRYSHVARHTSTVSGDFSGRRIVARHPGPGTRFSSAIVPPSALRDELVARLAAIGDRPRDPALAKRRSVVPM